MLVDSIDGDSAANEIVTSTGDLNSRESTKTTSSNGTSIIVIATACLASIVLAVFAYITIATRKKTSPHGELVEEDDESANNILNDLEVHVAGYMLSPKYIHHEPSSSGEGVLNIMTSSSGEGVLNSMTCAGPVHQCVDPAVFESAGSEEGILYSTTEEQTV
jgi:heme/copper-type cytochrome/quinol oxidase subunit 2